MNFIQMRANYKGKIYPIHRYHGYTLKEAVKKYREQYNLKHCKNVLFTKY